MIHLRFPEKALISGHAQWQTGTVAAPLKPSSPVFVGRDRELGIIRDLLERSAAEEAQTLVVSGDAGVGKTALVTRACSDWTTASTMFGACLPLT